MGLFFFRLLGKILGTLDHAPPSFLAPVPVYSPNVAFVFSSKAIEK